MFSSLSWHEWIAMTCAGLFCIIAMLVVAWMQDNADPANDGPEIDLIRRVHAE